MREDAFKSIIRFDNLRNNRPTQERRHAAHGFESSAMNHNLQRSMHWLVLDMSCRSESLVQVVTTLGSLV